jgi:TubC N-terminal docking domain
MNVVAELLGELTRCGVAVRVDGEAIRLKPKAALNVGLLARVKAHKPEILAVLNGKKPCLDLQSVLWRDPYARRLQAALTEICRPDYPAGMIPWLGERYPRLYAELTTRIPNDLSRIWRDQAPLEKFDLVLTRWSEIHWAAQELFRATGKPEQSFKRDEKDGELR